MGKWETIPFKKLYLIPSRNGLTRPRSVRGNGFPFINMGELFAYNRISDIETDLVELTLQEREKVTLKNGDLLFARQSLVFEGAGKCSIVINIKKTTAFESHIIRVRLNPLLANPNFYYYYFNSPLNPIGKIVQQCAQAGIRGSDLDNLKVTFPPLPTQEKIASILSAYDDAIENNNKRIKILEKMAENLYREWFVRMRFPGHETAEYENGLPKGWSVQKVGEIVSRLPFNKLYKKSDLLPDGNVIVVDQSAEEYIGFHNDEPSHFSDINHPIIIFGDHSCKYQLMTQNFSLGENIVPFTGKNCNTIFLFYAIRGIVTTTEYKRHWGELITKKILFPQIELQNKFAKMIAPCLQLERQLSSNNYNLTKQRNYQLLRLMSGKMEVTSR